MSDVKQEVEAAVKERVVAAENGVVSFIRANALKAMLVSAIVGAVAGHFA